MGGKSTGPRDAQPCEASRAAAGPEALPPPEELTPAALEELLGRLSAPTPHVAARLEMAHWRRTWQGHLGSEADG